MHFPHIEQKAHNIHLFSGVSRSGLLQIIMLHTFTTCEVCARVCVRFTNGLILEGLICSAML